MRPVRPALVAALLAVALAVIVPGAAMGAGPAPTEPCVPGTVWEDPVSGTKYLCIYDEGYGGPRWDLLASGQVGTAGWTIRSSTVGCAYLDVGLTTRDGYGAAAIVRSYRWPCAGAAERAFQPAGELRARIVIQRYAGSWSTCRDSGYRYSTRTADGWLAGLGMGIGADCGAGTYRAWGLGAFYQGGAWRGGGWTTPSLPFR